MVTEPHVSVAVATPVAFVVVGAGHSIVTFAGAVMVGAVVSRTVIVCTQLRLLPHASIAVQVREITLAPAQLLLTESTKPIVTPLHPSVAVATPVTLVKGAAGHSKVTFAGQVMVGGVVSRTVML